MYNKFFWLLGNQFYYAAQLDQYKSLLINYEHGTTELEMG